MLRVRDRASVRVELLRPTTRLPSLPERPTALPPAALMRGDDLLVDRAGQHHLDHLDGRAASVTRSPSTKFDLISSRSSMRADLRAAAMHHDRVRCRSASAARCRGRSSRRRSARPWRGRHISRRRSARRSAGCRAAPRQHLGLGMDRSDHIRHALGASGRFRRLGSGPFLGLCLGRLGFAHLALIAAARQRGQAIG